MYKVLIVLLTLATFSCQSDKKQPHQNALTAMVKNIEDGTSVYITEYGEGDKIVALDTVAVKKGKFEFEFPDRSYQTLNSIRIDGANGFVYVINEAEPLEITLLKDDSGFLLNEPKIKGGESNQLFVNYMGFLNETEQKLSELSEGYSPEELKDPKVQEQLREKEEKLHQMQIDFRRQSIDKHPNSLASAYILADLFSGREVSPEKLKAHYESLSDSIKNTFIGKQLGHAIAPAEGLKIGEKAPDFSAPTPEGNELSLKEILAKDGQYTLVEFWASWCPNCQEEMPHVVEVYNKYHDKGLNIISVSIDNSKEEWLKGIKDFDMNWDHISNLKQWEGSIVQEYGVTSIPNNYLLDKDGKVVAIKLLNKELKKKMNELLGE